MNPTKLKTDLTRAIQLFQNGDLFASKSLINKIIQKNEKITLCWFLLGVISIQESAFGDAIVQLTRAIKLQTNYPDAYNNLGVAYEQLGQIADAKNAYQKALSQKSNYHQALNNLANIYQQEGDLKQAIILYHEAIKYAPDYINALNSLGLCYLQKHRLSDAEKYLQQAIQLAPNDPVVLNNLGQFYSTQFHYEKAMDCFQKALEISPKTAAVLLNLGLLYERQNQLNEARHYYLEAAQTPDHRERAYNNLAMLELSSQNFQQGWPYYQYKQTNRELNNFERNVSVEDLKDKNILIEKDQGLGDELFFCRFLPFLTAIAKNIVYQTDSRLVSILSRSISNVTFISDPMPKQSFDISLPISELPRILWNQLLDQIPASIQVPLENSYLAKVTNSLPHNQQHNIAVSWEAGVPGMNTLYKRIDPLTLGKLLRNSNSNIFIIQRNPSHRDIDLLEKGLQRKAFNFSYINNDLEETLAFLSIIDDYLTVSNTNVHLMAALNKTARVFVPYPAEWRWTRAEQSPWFPKFPVYRQDSSGNWEKAFANCTDDLSKILTY